MKIKPLRMVFIGLSITSSWGNGHATTYRALLRELVKRGHSVLFLERDVPWYAGNRDVIRIPKIPISLYRDLNDLDDRFRHEIAAADLVVVGSYVPDGVDVSRWVLRHARRLTAFYDIDTPVTLAKLARDDHEYISPELIRRFDLYLSFSGGSVLDLIEEKYGAKSVRPLYCSVDPALYFPEREKHCWDLGYIGTYSPDRQIKLEEMMLKTADRWEEGRFIVAGPQYPSGIEWPKNCRRLDHLPPREHRSFYNRQRFTLNLTRADMVNLGYSPSVRIFEAAACGTPIISDYWEGLNDFLTIGEEILVVRNSKEMIKLLRFLPEDERAEIGARARLKILRHHTSSHRAAELESYVNEHLYQPALIPA